MEMVFPSVVAVLLTNPRQRVNIIRSSHTHMTHMVDSGKDGMVSHTEMVARFGDQWVRHMPYAGPIVSDNYFIFLVVCHNG